MHLGARRGEQKEEEVQWCNGAVVQSGRQGEVGPAPLLDDRKGRTPRYQILALSELPP